MKKISIQIAGLITLFALVISGCKKDEYEKNSIYTRFSGVDVAYHDTDPLSVTEFKEVEVGDEIVIDYTITSKDKDMFYVDIRENGSTSGSFTQNLTPAERRSFSSSVKIKLDSKTGSTGYRVCAYDSAGVFLGDGYKKINVKIKNDYYYWAGREIFVPDTVGKIAKCYIASSTGELLSYTDGLTNSEKIDIGYLYDPVKGHTFYSLKQSPTIFTPYDLSTFTKKETKLYSQNRAGQLSTFQRMKTAALVKSVPGNNKIVKSDPIVGMQAGYLTYFLTESGKYGGIYINNIYRNTANNGTFMKIDIKVQK